MSLKSVLKSSSTRNQYTSAFAVNIIALAHGCAIGWLSPSLPYLRSTETHLTSGPASSEDVSWIGSSICVGGFVGTIIFGSIAQRFGKKVALIMLVVPHFTMWTLIFFSTHIHHLLIARVLGGLTGGGMLRTVSLYNAEISEPKIRGKIGSCMVLFFSSGTLLAFIAGNYLSFFQVPLVMLISPTVFFISVLFLPDTPLSLMSRNKVDEAFESLKFYRTCGKNKVKIENLNEEFELLKNTLENKDYEKLELSDFLTKPAKTGLIIGMFLMILNQFSGPFTIMTYTADIFKSSGSDFTPNESSIIVAVIQLAGVYTSTICVEKFGRKILMTISCTGASLFFFILATYSYLKHSGAIGNDFEWIPVLSLSLVIFIASLGIISLPFLMVTELMPNKVRNVACTICLSTVTFLAFIVLKIFPPMVKRIGLHGCMWFFSSVCFVGLLVTILFIPETKGKSLISSNTKGIEEEGKEMLERDKIIIVPCQKPLQKPANLPN